MADRIRAGSARACASEPAKDGVRRSLRTGAVRPVEYESRALLLDALRRQRNAVTYLWAEDVEAVPELRVVAELWRERR